MPVRGLHWRVFLRLAILPGLLSVEHPPFCQLLSGRAHHDPLYFRLYQRLLSRAPAGYRHRLKFVVTSPAAPKKNTMSEARCWIPASDRAQMITVGVLKSWAERRNNSDAPLSFRSGLY